MKKVLHVGCGPKTKADLTKGFNTPDWEEIRYDIDPDVSPDILGTITDLSGVETESIDAIFSAHNIEHIYAHEVPIALAEFYRVLKPDGFLVITCPDLQPVCDAIAKDRLLEPMYQSPVGPISPLDILYGHRQSIAQGNLYMAHKCGFTSKVLGGTLVSAGFKGVFGMRDSVYFYLWFIASKSSQTDARLQEMARTYFPS